MPNNYPHRRLSDDRDPWDQQHKETPKAFHMFCHYRDLPIALRTVKRAFEDHRKNCRGIADGKPGNISHLPAEWGWVERAGAWDREVDRLARVDIAKAQVEAKKRHARIAHASLQVLSLPSYALIKASEDPAVLNRLIQECRTSSKAFVKMLDLASWSGRTMPGLVDVERLALGLSTDLVEIEDKHDDLGYEIAASPEAVELAATLLDELADTRARIAERAGDAGDAHRDRRALGPGPTPALPKPKAG